MKMLETDNQIQSRARIQQKIGFLTYRAIANQAPAEVNEWPYLLEWIIVKFLSRLDKDDKGNSI